MAYTSPIGSGFDLGSMFKNNASNTSSQTSTPAVSSNPGMGYFGNGGIFGTGIYFNGLAGPKIEQNPNNPQISGPTSEKAVGQVKGGFNAPTASATGAAPAATKQLAQQNAQPGDPWFGVTQDAVTPGLTNFLNGMSTRGMPTTDSSGNPIPPSKSSTMGTPNTGYNINTPTTIPSNIIGSGNTYADVIRARSNLMSDYQSAAQKYVQDYQNITGQQIKSQFAGDTQDYGTGMANLVKMESTPVLTADQMAASNALNALGANATTAGLVNPINNQIAPGSTAINPLTMQPAVSGMGASPSTVLSTAQQLMEQARQQGTLQLNPDGSINMQPYIQQAQSLYGSMGGTSGAAGGGNVIGGGGTTTGTPLTQGGVGGYTPPQPGSPEFYDALPATVAPSFRQTSTGQSYFDMSNLDSAGLGTARQISKAYGIPILPADDAKAVQTVDQAQKNLVTLQQNFTDLASNSAAAALASNLTDPASLLFQTNYGSKLDTYNSNRDALLQQIRALAGMSPRLTNVELNLSQGALPTLTEGNKDTVQTGINKINTVSGYLNNALSTLIPKAGKSGASVGGTLNSPATTNSQYNW